MPKDQRLFVAFSEIDPGENISDQLKKRVSEGLEDFARTIDRLGLIQPLVVREGGASRGESKKRRYKLRIGFRRYYAIDLLRKGILEGQLTTPKSWDQVSVIFSKKDDKTLDAMNLVENLQRKDLDPLEEALAMQEYLDKHGVTQAQLAREIGKSEPYVSQRLALLRASSDGLRAALRDGVLTPSHAREITSLSKPAQDVMVSELRDKVSRGEKINAADVHEESLSREKAPRETKKGGRKADPVDKEKIAVARDAYKNKTIAPRKRAALLEGLGVLVLRDNRNASDKTTHSIAVLEWVLGLRENL